MALFCAVSTSLVSANLTNDIPVIETHPGFNSLPDHAQYKNSDWSHVAGIAKGISLEKAFEIANNNPEITYFFYTKGLRMVLETESGDARIFSHGDTVFFTGEETPWLGTAPGLADVYSKSAIHGNE